MFGKTPAPVVIEATQHVVTLAPSNEAYIDSLREQFPEYSFGAQPSVESQQLDESQKQAAIDEMQTTLDGYLKSHPHTGPMNVYLLDGKGVAGMDEQNEGPLRAVVAQVIADPSHTVAALLPEDQSITTAEQLSPSSLLRALAETVLSVESATLLIGREALESYLYANRYATGVAETSPFPASESHTDADAELIASTENEPSSLPGTIILGTVGAILLGNWLWEKFQAFKAARQPPNPTRMAAQLDGEVKEVNVMIKQVEKHYLDPAWLAKQTFVTGEITAGGIADTLAIGAGLPRDVPASALMHAKTVHDVVTRYAAANNAYVHEVNAVGEKLAASNPADFAKACEAADAVVGKIKTPFERTPPTANGLLGNPRLELGKDRHGRLTNVDITFEYLKGKTVPVHALDQAGVIAMAKALIVVMRQLTVVDGIIENVEWTHSGDENIFDKTAPDGTALWDLMNETLYLDEAFWPSGQEHLHREYIWELRTSLSNVAAAMFKWIARSVK